MKLAYLVIWAVIIGLAACLNNLPEPWLPLRAGDHWTMRDALTGAETQFDVLSAPDLCGSPQFILRITKQSAESYWNPGLSRSVDFSLRVFPDGRVQSPASLVYENMQATGEPSTTVLTPAPSGELLREANARVNYAFLPGYVRACEAGTSPAIWTTNVSVQGDLLTARYTEGPPGDPLFAQETWTFQRGIGLVRIVADELGRHIDLRREVGHRTGTANNYRIANRQRQPNHGN